MNLPGVFQAMKKDGTVYYRASITYRSKHISLGSYSSPYKASAAYEEASALLSSPDSYAYSKNCALSFEKWVVLTNFRDNGIYIKNPIYLRQNYFLYFLSPELEYKFDIEDLFYYSNHKIMKRNGHLFVADYGMQVNILSRYGIRNHAVIGRDYRFVNGDCTDFRYENIEIINRFYGVRKLEKQEKTVYQTRIHIRGDFIAGVYETETEAAIAYNKAADILKKNGVARQYPTNYIEELSAKEYADIYTRLPISEKIVHYSPV